MASITFHYGAMGCGKSAYALQLRHSLEEAGFVPCLVKPVTDTRSTEVKSRIGISHPCRNVAEDDDLSWVRGHSHLVIDEAQFLSPTNVSGLPILADEFDVEVHCFGLRTDYTGCLFEATASLFAIADDLRELPVLYRDGRKAIMHLRTVDGSPVFDGDPISVGDLGDQYESVSRREYFRRRRSAWSS
jgi:thymidine kinase